jgi:hypothetical protein
MHLIALLSLTAAVAAARCSSQTQENTIYLDFPFVPTGVINGTLLILSIPLDVARSILPQPLKILTKAYHDLLVGYPLGQSPVLVQGVQDHDIRVGDLAGLVADFSVSNSKSTMAEARVKEKEEERGVKQ